MLNGLFEIWSKVRFNRYCEMLWGKFPAELIEIHIAILFLGILLTMYITQDKKKRLRYCSLTILLLYISMVLCSALLLREASESYQYRLIPFWSYDAFIRKDSQLLTQIYLNVIIFIPIGFLFGTFSSQNRLERTLLCGAALSLLIEFCQLFLKKGIFEFDDIFHNILGCYFGYLLLGLVKKQSNNIESFRQFLKTRFCY